MLDVTSGQMLCEHDIGLINNYEGHGGCLHSSALSDCFGLNFILAYSVLSLDCIACRVWVESPRFLLFIEPKLLLLGNCRSAYMVGVPRTFLGNIKSG